MAESALPDIALVDMAMPVMGGDELIPVLRERYPAMKIVLASGYPLAAGEWKDAVGYLQKPYSAGALTEAIAARLDR